MRFAFVDTEYTGEHPDTTLVSLAVVGTGEETLSVTLNDYERGQVTPWLRDHVISRIDTSQSVSSGKAYSLVAQWFDEYSRGEHVSLVSVGKMFDLMLLFRLWQHSRPDRLPVDFKSSLPAYLHHSFHLDLETVLFLAGLDPGCDRAVLTGYEGEGQRHEALYDARLARECFKFCLTAERFPYFRHRATPGRDALDWTVS